MAIVPPRCYPAWKQEIVLLGPTTWASPVPAYLLWQRDGTQEFTLQAHKLPIMHSDDLGNTNIRAAEVHDIMHQTLAVSVPPSNHPRAICQDMQALKKLAGMAVIQSQQRNAEY